MKSSTAMPLVGIMILIGLLVAASLRNFSTNIFSPTTAISGIVVPHHDLVKEQRTKLFAEVAARVRRPSTIILVSPNHYNAGRGDIQITKQDWHLSTGNISANHTVLAHLEESGVSVEPASFNDEHGIHLVLGDIQRHFPNAQLVPIIIKSHTPVSKVEELAATLKNSCNACLMIASVDFSHYQPALLAELHDELTIRALKTLNTNLLLTKAEVDAPTALALLATWAKSHATESFVQRHHTNSGSITNNPDIETTTHLFGWYEAGEAAPPEANVTFLIGGDMMFGRGIAHTFLPSGLETSVEKLGERLFWGVDAAIINLEGPVSDRPVPDNPDPKNLRFHFPPQTLDVLQYLRINVASLANNHSANAGLTGLATTRQLLERANIQPLGGPGTNDVDQVVIIPGHQLKLAIIGVHELISQPDLTPLIQSLKQDPAVRVLVFPHWGVEYALESSSRQRERAHSFIDAGADAVIGAHPHVIQESEVYNGKPIVYSLGNLLFDQNFSPATQQGLLIAGSFTNEGLSLFGLPVQAINHQPQLMRGLPKQKVLDRLYQPWQEYTHPTPAGPIFFFPQ